ncbi:MAG: hypothetical protein A2W05_06530 [Candidatus Schekmanbacteria bacterium RBG_16_38_10]|uniref:Glycosyltransferase n=1 Tax=Candidatus Schekmanbacteria bacterium RBG_16_38_10 TaxID=1817879 RepID=A0A1F7RTP0_9BACT|nr:MAG: hypothetical protein A2W05_06530 [Candidatus Schekmanbacteria bacterium RBG_16_38_10]
MDRMIRVLNVLPLGSIGGAERFVLSLCRHHDKSRFEIVVCVLFEEGTVSDEIAAAGIEVIPLHMANGFDIPKAIKLINIIRSRKIDIVNIHGQNPLSKLCSVFSLCAKVIHTDHGTTAGALVKRKRRVVFFNRLLTPFINHFIAISEGMERSLMQREWVPSEKITLIYNGVDVDAIASVSSDKNKLRRDIDIPENIAIIGTVGRLVAEKQYAILIEALSFLHSKDIEFVALIIGDGPQKDTLKELAVQKGLEKRIKFLGQRNDVYALIGLMDVFVFASAGEAFSITILEAMAKSKPIVAFDVEGVNEAVVNDETGFLVPSGDIQAFSHKIELLIKSPDIAAKMGVNALKRVREMFDIRKNIKKLESLYERCIAC